jgi:ATP synthase protein I
MSEREPRDLEDLDARLREARRRSSGASRAPGGAKDLSGGGLGLALRLSVELVAALVVGVGIGLLLDHWLGTKPWLLILFFVLGSAAGLLNVMRVMAGQGGAIGFPRKDVGAKLDRSNPPEDDE